MFNSTSVWRSKSKRTYTQDKRYTKQERVHEAESVVYVREETMRGLVRGKNGRTKHGGEDQGECDKVKKEDDLEDQSRDGKNLPKNGVANVKCKVHCKGGNDCPG